MIFAKDHKTLDMFDPLAHFGHHRGNGWRNRGRGCSGRRSSPNSLSTNSDRSSPSRRGRPTKDLCAMLGIALLQQMHDLLDEETRPGRLQPADWYWRQSRFLMMKKIAIITGYFNGESYGLVEPQMAATMIQENILF